MVRTWFLPALIAILLAPTALARGRPETLIRSSETYGEKLTRLRWRELNDRPPNVYFPAGIEDVPIRRVAFEVEPDLLAEIYYPPRVAGTDPALPVVILPMGFTLDNIRDYGQKTPLDNAALCSWAALFAMRGIAAVVYEATTLDDDFRALLGFLDAHSEQLGIDLSRTGIWAGSGHGRFASQAMAFPELRDRLRAVMFVHADPRPSIMPEGDILYYLIYTEDDSRWHQSCAALARRAEIAGNSVTVDTRAHYKNFFMHETSDEAQDVVRTAINWMGRQLSAAASALE